MTDRFAEWLRKGLGRAAIHLMSQAGKPYREAILHACTHNLAYDAQCEDSRAQYLIDLIELTQDREFYRDGILKAIRQVEGSFDLGQLFELGARFARQGDEEMKRAMYSTFEERGYSEVGLTGAEQLVALSGLPGLEFVCRTFGSEPDDDRPWQFRTLLEALEKNRGKQQLPESLSGFATEVEADDERRRQQGPYVRETYERVRARIIDKGRSAGMVGWSRQASTDELDRLADDLLNETDNDRLYSYVRMFQLRPFPRKPDRLIELAGSSDEGLARAAMLVLALVEHPAVRTLALDPARHPSQCDLAIRMLTRNFEPGDYQRIEKWMERPAADPDADHSHGFALLKLVKEHPTSEAEQSLVRLYEDGVCLHCRCGCVEQMIAVDCLPKHLRDECAYDASPAIRELIKQKD